MSHYTVTAERSGKWWTLQCVEVPGAISQVQRLDQADGTIREAIAWVADVPDEEIDVELQVVLPTSVVGHLEAARSLREESAAFNTRAAEQTRAAVGELHSAQLTYREIGFALGISYQRVAQLATEARGVQHA